MKKRLKRVWENLVKFFSNKRMRDIELLLGFEIKQRKELEAKVSHLELEHRRIKFDINRSVNDKIQNYEKLFTASKMYGDNLIKVAIKAHDSINREKNKNEK